MNTTNTFLRFHDNNLNNDVHVSIDSLINGGTPIDDMGYDMELVTETLYKEVNDDSGVTTYVPMV